MCKMMMLMMQLVMMKGVKEMTDTSYVPACMQQERNETEKEGEIKKERKKKKKEEACARDIDYDI